MVRDGTRRTRLEGGGLHTLPHLQGKPLEVREPVLKEQPGEPGDPRDLRFEAPECGGFRAQTKHGTSSEPRRGTDRPLSGFHGSVATAPDHVEFSVCAIHLDTGSSASSRG